MATRFLPVTPVDDRIERALTLAFPLAAVVALVQDVAHVAAIFVFDGEVKSLNADEEGTPFAWASSVSIFSGAFTSAALAALGLARRALLIGLAAILAFLSLDEMIALHEGLGDRARDAVGLTGEWGRVTWPAVFFPLLAAAFVLLWRISSSARGRAREAIPAGLVLLAGAVVLEVAETLWYESGGTDDTWPAAVEVALEEGAEVAAWILIAGGLASILCAALVAAGRGGDREASESGPPERNSG